MHKGYLLRKKRNAAGIFRKKGGRIGFVTCINRGRASPRHPHQVSPKHYPHPDLRVFSPPVSRKDPDPENRRFGTPTRYHPRPEVSPAARFSFDWAAYLLESAVLNISGTQILFSIYRRSA